MLEHLTGAAIGAVAEKTGSSDIARLSGKDVGRLPSDRWEKPADLPSDKWKKTIKLPNDVWNADPRRTAVEKGEKTAEMSKGNTYSDLHSMQKDTGKTYKEIKENNPPNSPNIAKWFDNGGSITIGEKDGKQVWTYKDKDGREVSYVDGRPEFPPEAKHPEIKDIDIGEFTGDRVEDKKRYLQKLEEQYGLTEIPEGYDLHHDAKNGNMQLVKTDWHKEFTHMGGHSIYKEG